MRKVHLTPPKRQCSNNIIKCLEYYGAPFIPAFGAKFARCFVISFESGDHPFLRSAQTSTLCTGDLSKK